MPKKLTCRPYEEDRDREMAVQHILRMADDVLPREGIAVDVQVIRELIGRIDTQSLLMARTRSSCLGLLSCTVPDRATGMIDEVMWWKNPLGKYTYAVMWNLFQRFLRYARQEGVRQIRLRVHQQCLETVDEELKSFFGAPFSSDRKQVVVNKGEGRQGIPAWDIRVTLPSHQGFTQPNLALPQKFHIVEKLEPALRMPFSLRPYADPREYIF